MRVLVPCFLVNTECFPTFKCLPAWWVWNGTAWFYIEFPWWIMKLEIFHIGPVWFSLKCLLVSFPNPPTPSSLSFPYPLIGILSIVWILIIYWLILKTWKYLTVQVLLNGNVSKMCPVEIYSPYASILSKKKKKYFDQISKLLGDRKGSKQLVEEFCEQICLALEAVVCNGSWDPLVRLPPPNHGRGRALS